MKPLKWAVVTVAAIGLLLVWIVGIAFVYYLPEPITCDHYGDGYRQAKDQPQKCVPPGSSR